MPGADGQLTHVGDAVSSPAAVVVPAGPHVVIHVRAAPRKPLHHAERLVSHAAAPEVRLPTRRRRPAPGLEATLVLGPERRLVNEDPSVLAVLLEEAGAVLPVAGVDRVRGGLTIAHRDRDVDAGLLERGVGNIATPLDAVMRSIT